MTKFNRKFPAPWMNALSEMAQHKGWWRELLDYRFQDVGGAQQQLTLAVRDGYLNAYVEGQSVLKILFNDAGEPPRLCAQIHYKYLGGDYQVFNGMEIERTIYIPGGSLDCWIRKAQTFAKPKYGSSDYSEKQGVAAIVGRNSNVIDLEMALPGEVAPRIDMVALERSGSAINIVFYEAKLFSNPGLRAKNFLPKVLEQLDRYETWLTSNDRTGEVINAYRETCRLLIRLREMQGIPVDELIVEASMAGSDLRVDPRPRLIVFGYDENKPDSHWPPHETVLRRAGLDRTRLIMEPHPKDIRLSRGTFPEGYIDEAEDILESTEGPEMVEKISACVRHHKLFAIARFAPAFAKPGFQFAAPHEQPPERPSTKKAPGPHLSETAYEFIEAACGAGWVELADWRTWSLSPEAQALDRDPARIATASEDQLGRLLTAHIRKDRFEKGTLNAAFEAGVLTAIVQRAEALLQGRCNGA